jgi:hypothetical protein
MLAARKLRLSRNVDRCRMIDSLRRSTFLIREIGLEDTCSSCLKQASVSWKMSAYVHHQRRKNSPQYRSPEVQIIFNIHNPSQDHRDRNACGFLLTP